MPVLAPQLPILKEEDKLEYVYYWSMHRPSIIKMFHIIQHSKVNGISWSKGLNLYIKFLYKQEMDKNVGIKSIKIKNSIQKNHDKLVRFNINHFLLNYFFPSLNFLWFFLHYILLNLLLNSGLRLLNFFLFVILFT